MIGRFGDRQRLKRTEAGESLPAGQRTLGVRPGRFVLVFFGQVGAVKLI